MVIMLICSAAAYGATTAITENGDSVILKEDGTWIYSKTNSDSLEEIPRVEEEFEKGKESSFNLKSKVAKSSFWINPKEWSFSIEKDKNAANEYAFSIPGTDLYGMVISEALQIKPEELVNIAFENARSFAPDMRVVKKEYRTVNGNEVIHMIMSGTIQSIEFTYVGYYHSNEFGSTQFLTYTGTNLLPKYEEHIYSLLNGFDTTK